MKAKNTEKSADHKIRRPLIGRIEKNQRTSDSVENFKNVEATCPSQMPSWESQKVASIAENKCEHCDQAEDVVFCSKPLPEAWKEDDVLISMKTSYYNDTPCLSLDYYRVYDELRHLCAFDGKLLEKASCLYFSGYVKSFSSETSGENDGYPCEDIGPITDWWIEEDTKIGLSSGNAYYYLENPMPEYIPFIKSVNEKVFVSKTVIATLQEESLELDYEGLLSILSNITLADGSTIDENVLLRHGSFICRQVQIFDSDADNEAKIISIASCVETLAKKVNFDFSNVIQSDDSDETDNDCADTDDENTCEELDDDLDPIETGYKRRQKKPVRNNRFIIRPKKRDSLITTTPLVRQIFMDYLTNHIMKESNNCKESQVVTPEISSYPQMEVDVTATGPDPGSPNVTVEFLGVYVETLSEDVIKSYLEKNVLDHQNSDEKIPLCESDIRVCVPRVRQLKTILIERLSDEVVNFYLHKYSESSERRKYLKCETENKNNENFDRPNLEVLVGDFVSMYNSSSIARVQYLYENSKKSKKYFHAQWFVRSIDTILAETGHPNELFVTNQCEDIMLKDCCKVVNVEHVPTKSDWYDNGNVEYVKKLERNEDPSCYFYYQKRYCNETARFEDLEPESFSSSVDCCCCQRKEKLESLEMPAMKENMVQWRNEEYRVGCCVFLNPGTIMKRQAREQDDRQAEDDEMEKDYDEELYPEKYRKMFPKKRTTDEVGYNEPFDVAYICNIWSKKSRITKSSDILLDVKKFYRPQNTCLSKNESRKMDFNLLYFSDEDSTIDFSNVQGKCYVSYKENLSSSVEDWSQKGPYRFYFSKSYNRKSKSFTSPPAFATKIGKIDESQVDVEEDVDIPPDYPPISGRLRSLDVFCGCGGLSCGLEEANIATCQWAVDKDYSSSRAFKQNFPSATVINADANIVLKAILENKTSFHGQMLPQKGEVDLLCGGPPCQGFSLLNRNPTGQSSRLYNTLIATFLSYCDHLRPKFFVLENVRHFVRHKSNVLKLTLNCLVRMGYQVAFFVLQSGRYGVPQSRPRVIIIAAAPGEALPVQPECLHTCPVGSTFETTLDDAKYSSAVWKTSAPYRMIDVYDAISDLPPIGGLQYTVKPITHYQRQLRIRNGVNEEILRDHISYQLTPIVEKRISFIPTNSECDWRDLPNIVVQLRDGTKTRKLKYTHGPKSPKGMLRGVCSCSENGKCNKKYRQRETLIPWCLSHTASRNNQWTGYFSRLRFDYIFKTINTCVSSSGGKHLVHPVDNRIVSVREYGRSVGFPDSFEFYGSLREKYRQIGNCVAPPLGKAIGLQIRQAVYSRAASADESE